MDEGKLLNEAAKSINDDGTHKMTTNYYYKPEAKVQVQNTVKNQKRSDLEKWVEFINKNKLAFQSDGKSYLKVEAWNFLFTLKGLAPTITDVKSAQVPKIDGEDGETTMGFFVQATLIPLSKKVPDDKGVPLASSAYGACTVGENDYCDDYYSALSMAQTRAIGKLGRSVFGHLAVACGFQACPFEEIKK